MKKIVLLILVLSIFTLIRAEEKEFKRKTLTMVVPFLKSHKEDVKYYKYLKKYLEQKLDRKIKLRAIKGYTNLADMLETGSADLAILTPIIYTAFLEEKNLDYIGTVVFEDRSYFRSLCLTNRNSTIENIYDLKNKNIGFTEKYSASGYIFPKLFLRNRGLIKGNKDLFKSGFSKFHKKLLNELSEENYDAIFTFDMEYNKYKELFKLVYVCPVKIPHAAFVANRRTLKEKGLIKKIKKLSREFRSEVGVQRLKVDKSLYYSLKSHL